MSNQFDELAKGLAQSLTRRAALKKFGVGFAGMALASPGLANNSEAAPAPQTACLPRGSMCKSHNDCCSGSCPSTRHSKFFPNLPKYCA